MDKLLKRPQTAALIIFFAFFFIWIPDKLTVKADTPVIIVIDPGHGGENLGAQHDGYTEKDMTMTVALSMKEELEKYDNVVVYLTREGDVDMTIKDRALFAKEKNADFLFCLHFNSSVNHNLYGSEVWVSAFGDYYVKGRQFAEINMQLFEEMGLFSRGIKTRMNDDDDNYYGILRYCTDEGIPAALIEHCHLDHEKDKPFYQQGEEQLKEFGRKDAEAAARYFGLTSSKTGADHRNYPKENIPYREVVRPDKTEPEECSLEILNIDEEKGIVTVSLEAMDSDSYIQYYSYSLDGGNTYSELFGFPRSVWNQSMPGCTFTVQVPFEKDTELCAVVYNGFDVPSESNKITIPGIPAPQKTKEPGEDKVYREITYEPVTDISYMDRQEKIQFIILIILISLIMTGILYVMIKMIFKLKRGNKRRKGR